MRCFPCPKIIDVFFNGVIAEADLDFFPVRGGDKNGTDGGAVGQDGYFRAGGIVKGDLGDPDALDFAKYSLCDHEILPFELITFIIICV